MVDAFLHDMVHVPSACAHACGITKSVVSIRFWSSVVCHVVFSKKIARFRDLGIRATPKHNESVNIVEKPATFPGNQIISPGRGGGSSALMTPLKFSLVKGSAPRLSDCFIHPALRKREGSGLKTNPC